MYYKQVDCPMSEINNMVITKDYERLSNAFTNQIFKLAHYYKSKIQFEDLVQIGHTALLEAAEKFNPNMNTRFTPFANLYIRGRMLEQLKKNRHTMFSIDGDNEKLEGCLDDEKLQVDPCFVKDEQKYFEIGELFNEHLTLCRELSAHDCSIFFDYFLEFDESVESTSKKYNCSKQHIYNVIERSLNKIKKTEFPDRF